MTNKTGLVKIGVTSEQAQTLKGLRRVRQILEQHDATVARVNAATQQRLREAVAEDDLAPLAAGASTDGQSDATQH